MKKNPDSEYEIHKKVVSFLSEIEGRDSTFFFYHPNNKVFRFNSKAIGVRSGVPDFCIISKGKPCYLELKTKKGRLSPSQKKFRDFCLANKIDWMVSYGLEEAKTLINCKFNTFDRD